MGAPENVVHTLYVTKHFALLHTVCVQTQ